MVSAIVATLEGKLTTAAAASLRRKPTESWTAYDFLLRGRELCNDSNEPDAVPYFSRAAEIDPGFAQAHAWLALTVSFKFDAKRQTLEGALRAARKALAIDGNDPIVQWGNAMAHFWSRNLDRAGLHFDRAIALNPSDPQIRA